MIVDFRGLIAAAPVAALVGDRVHPIVRPQGGALPAVVYQVIGSRPLYHMQGADGLMRSRVQVDAWAQTYLGAVALAEAIAAAASGFRGVSGATDFAGVFLDASRDTFDPAGTDGAAAYRRSVDFIVHHRSADT